MSSIKAGLPRYWLIAVILGLLSVILGVTAFPIPSIRPLSIVVTSLFLALPLLAIYFGGEANWTRKLALGYVLLGVLLQGGAFFLIDQRIATGLLGAVASGVSAVGLLTWCMGFGALIACLVKEKNILLPMSIALAAIDIFLVMTPIGPTQAMMKANPKLLQSIALTVPKVQAAPTSGPVVPALLIGPADLLFSAMFFVAIFRYKMKSKATLIALIPVLIAYMGIVVMFGIPLPAMVPIGLTVLLINIREFDLSRDEWIMTAVVALFFGALIAWGLTRKPRPASLPEAPVQEIQAPAPRPLRANPGSPPSPVPTAP